MLNQDTGDIKHSFADISKAYRFLDYEPIIDFEEGLKATVEVMQCL